MKASADTAQQAAMDDWDAVRPALEKASRELTDSVKEDVSADKDKK